MTVVETPSSSVELAASDLQATLIELVELALQGKQAHWNVTGPDFRSVHLQLDDIVELARRAADDVAERIAAIGRAPDARPWTVASAEAFTPIPGGTIGTRQAVDHLAGILDQFAARLRERIGRLGTNDAVSQGILIELAGQVDKQAWMLRAQLG